MLIPEAGKSRDNVADKAPLFNVRLELCAGIAATSSHQGYGFPTPTL
jgi:hypothetical protein